MIFFILAVFDKLPYDLDVWSAILFEVLIEVGMAVLVYAAWSRDHMKISPVLEFACCIFSPLVALIVLWMLRGIRK